MTSEERIAQLEEEVAYLRRELGDVLEATSVERLRRQLRVEPMQARILLRLALAKGRVVTQAQLMDLHDRAVSPNTLRVHLHRLSKAVGTPVAMAAWRGYVITPAGAALVARTLRPAQDCAA